MNRITREGEDIRLIPIDRIEILNPRERNQKTFREIVASIKALGLKKPITVTRRGEGDKERFILVCGQIEKRQLLGKNNARKTARPGTRLSSSALVRAYNQEVQRQKMLIRKSDLVQQRMAFIVAAMTNLLGDENFVNLLRAEGLSSQPRQLEDRIRGMGRA